MQRDLSIPSALWQRGQGEGLGQGKDDSDRKIKGGTIWSYEN